MKKKIFIGLIILSLCFIAGGLYITRTIDHVTLRLEKIIALHQVEILRKNLLTHVKVVQEDLLLKDSPHATDVDLLVQHGERMGDAVDNCFDCHHVETTQNRLEELQKEIYIFQKDLSRVYTVRANFERLTRERQAAFAVGQHIIEEINKIIVFSSDKLARRTQMAMEGIAVTKRLLTLLVILGPVFALSIAAYFVKDFTGSVGALIRATRRLKAGDLDYKITGLQNEFGELAQSINEMATSLKETIHKIEETQKRYRMLFESAGDAIFILEAEGEDAGRIVSANKAAAQLHDYTVNELLEMNIRDLDDPKAAAESSGRIQQMLAGEWINAEIAHQKKDGTVFPVEISAGLLEFEDHKYILAFDRDITLRKKAEQALQHAQQLARVGEMAAGLAHEIKNPLAGIKVSIEVLASELELKPDDKEVLQRIIDEINRIETLLKNLLSYARPPKPHFVPVEMNKIIEAAIKNAQFTLQKPARKKAARKVKEIQFVQELNDRLPALVADSSQLQQVILNLILNAIDSIQESGTVTVKSEAVADGFIQISISDTGKGCDEEDIDKMFQPFFTTKPKGTGLGLSISKRLVEQHNGTIRVVRNQEKGLKFMINLPVKQEKKVKLL